MHSLGLYAKITFVNDPLFPDVYFVSFNNSVFIVSSVAIVLGHNICVCHLLSYKEISFLQEGVPQGQYLKAASRQLQRMPLIGHR